VEQTGTTPTDPSPKPQGDEIRPTPPADGANGTGGASGTDGANGLPAEPSGFQPRGRARRRARFLRKARELAYRDLGGLVFNLHRYGQRNDALVLAKLTTLGQIDAELRSIEAALGERRPITVLREAGITACPRCAAIHSSEDNFCPNCGMSMGRHADLPIAGAATPPPPTQQPISAAAVSGSAPQPSSAAAVPTPDAKRAPSAPQADAPPRGPVPAAQPAPSTSTPASEPVPATPPAGRSPNPPATDGPTEIIRPPAADA
jgi:zinc-ribbon domain